MTFLAATHKYKNALGPRKTAYFAWVEPNGNEKHLFFLLVDKKTAFDPVYSKRKRDIIPTILQIRKLAVTKLPRTILVEKTGMKLLTFV